MPVLPEGGRHSIREYLTSDTIALEAIDSNTSFNVHESLLHSLSPALSAACSSKWKEGTLRRYKFHEDVTEQVLLCFLTWAYYGDYDSDSGDDIQSSSLSLNPETERQQNTFRSITKKKSKKDKQKQLSGALIENMLWSEKPIADESVTKEPTVEYADEADRNAHEGSSIRPPSPFTSDMAKDNAVHPLLLHAKLYTFAHAYLIEPLKTSTKQKIVDQLEKLDSLSKGHERAAVFDVLAYTFSRLPEEDPLIQWLARYASWRLDELRQMPTRFDDLLTGGDSAFLKLLLRYVSRSTVNPFNLQNEQAMPPYPISTPAVRYVPWRGY